MNPSTSPALPLHVDDLRHLDGRVVLVKSSRGHHTPETAMRGWIEVHQDPGRDPEVRIAVEFPQMFTNAAHRRMFTLDQAELTRLLQHDNNLVFEYTTEGELE